MKGTLLKALKDQYGPKKDIEKESRQRSLKTTTNFIEEALQCYMMQLKVLSVKLRSTKIH